MHFEMQRVTDYSLKSKRKCIILTKQTKVSIINKQKFPMKKLIKDRSIVVKVSKKYDLE